MSRLTTQDILNISVDPRMIEAARLAYPFSISPFGVRVAVVPVTSGLGVIPKFAESVREILAAVGCDAFVTGSSDVAGLSEAYKRNADIVFMADDIEFAAYSLNSRVFASNGECTGRAFAAALELSASGVNGKEVLVLGFGAVGQAAAEYLTERGTKVLVCDKDSTDWKNTTHQLILDATSERDIITGDNVTADTILSLPGMPIGVNPDVLRLCRDVIHSPLELGTIAMLAKILASEEKM